MAENINILQERLNEIRDTKDDVQAKKLAREYYAQALENPDISWSEINGVAYQTLKSRAIGWPIADNPKATLNGIGQAASDITRSTLEPVTNTGQWLIKRALNEIEFIQHPIESLKAQVDNTVGNHMESRLKLAAVMRIEDEDARISELTRNEWRPVIGWGLAATGPKIALDTPAATAAAMSATGKVINGVMESDEGLVTANGAPVPLGNKSKVGNIPQAGSMNAHGVHPDEVNNMNDPKFGNDLKAEGVVIPRQATTDELIRGRKGNGRNDVVPGYEDLGIINKMEHVGDTQNGIKVVSFVNATEVKLFRHVGTDISEMSLNEALYSVSKNPEARANLLYNIKKLDGEKQIELAVKGENFFNSAVENTEKKLNAAADEYVRTARSAKTFGDELNRYEGHENSLVLHQIATERLDALQYGRDASINNPVIADLTRNGSNSQYFNANEVIRELKKIDVNQPIGQEQVAEMALDATKLAHKERRNFLIETEKARPLTPAEQVELKVGDQYGDDAAAHARHLIKEYHSRDIENLYPYSPKNEYLGPSDRRLEATDRRMQNDLNNLSDEEGPPQKVRRILHAREVPGETGNLEVNVSEDINIETERRVNPNWGRRSTDVKPESTIENSKDSNNIEPLSFKEAIQHLENPKAQEVVLARINEQTAAVKAHSQGVELA